MSPRTPSTSTSASTPEPAREPSTAGRRARQGSTEPPAPAKPPAKPRAAAKPLTARELSNRLLRLAAQRHQPRSAVKLSVGPRGQVMPDVLSQAGDDPELLHRASLLAQAEFDKLCAKYGVVIVPAPAGTSVRAGVDPRSGELRAVRGGADADAE